MKSSGCLNRFKLFRFLQGGSWARLDGKWSKADNDGFHRVLVAGYCQKYHSFHHSYNGIEQREEYK